MEHLGHLFVGEVDAQAAKPEAPSAAFIAVAPRNFCPVIVVTGRLAGGHEQPFSSDAL
jgi:hypothetical protein